MQFRPIPFCNKERKVDDDGKVNIFIDIVESIGIRDSLTIISKNPNGTTHEERPSDNISGWLLVAGNDKSVTTVLKLFGHSSNDWVNLYRIYEVIRDNVGNDGKIVKAGWTTLKAIKRFTQTVNSPSILEDEARHGVQKTQPPQNPMSFSEAKALIESIAHAWLESKRKASKS